MDFANSPKISLHNKELSSGFSPPPLPLPVFYRPCQLSACFARTGAELPPYVFFACDKTLHCSRVALLMGPQQG